MKKKNIGTGTKLIHHTCGECDKTGAVNVPIYQVSTFRQEAPGRNKGYDYSRSGNPTRAALEKYIAELEGAAAGFAFSSGMAAITAALMLIDAGDHIVATEDLYGGSYRALTQVLTRFGISQTFVDTSDAGAVEAAITPATKMIFFESPTNPLMKIADISKIVKVAEKRRIITVIDNTFATPLLQNPHALGVDVVVHSATKYLGGHSDLIIGLATARNAPLARRIGQLQNALGAVPSPLDCWLLIRGMKTLKARMAAQQGSARRIAAWLDAHPRVDKVMYPGLKSHVGYAVHKKQASGPGAMISFYTHDEKTAKKVLSSVKIWTLAVSLGAVESIITYPVKMTHVAFPTEELERLGINGRLIRLSVGLEDTDDLVEDLAQALGGR